MAYWRALATAGLLALALPACETVPATARPAAGPALAANVLSPSDRATGKDAYQQITAQFGGTVGGPVADYVRRVGLKVALEAVPDSRPEDWTITVLNSPVPNAMATPGGYLYITRGLLAMINSEAELASVLGHEAGHVAGRHTSKRNSRATIAGIGTLAAAILGGGDIANIVNMGGQAWVSGYSRSQENEADARGLTYSAAAGYDPRAAATMLQSLERISTVEGKRDQPDAQSIFATHPITSERVARVRQLAADYPAGGAIDHAAYLDGINGIAYGDSPDEGIISGTRFEHGALKLAFEAPRGFTLENTPQAVRGTGPGSTSFVFSGAGNVTLAQAVDTVWRGIGNGRAPAYREEQRTINGQPALLTTGQGRLSSGAAVDVGVAAYQFPGAVYVFRTVAPTGQGQIFQSLYQSMRPLSASDAAKLAQGLHIRVVAAAAGDTAQSLARRMAAPYDSAERFLALNGLPASARITAGEKVKLIVRQ